MMNAIMYHVLSSISNDFEDFETVVSDVSRSTTEKGQNVTREKIIRALEEAIHEGSAGAYILSAVPSRITPTVFSIGKIDKLWFRVTPKGKKLVERLDRQSQGNLGP
jgi:hypothetical protein